MPRERFIGLVLTHAYSFYRDILRGVTRFAESRPHWRFVSLAAKTDRQSRETLKHVDAAITCTHSREWCDFVLRTGVPFVNIDTLVPGLPVPRIGVDNRLIGKLAAQHFLERGLRSFAFVGHPRHLFSVEREQAFRAALATSGHKLAVYHSNRLHDFLECVLSLDGGIGRWLRSLPRPAGVFTPNDLWAVELMKACRDSGLRVPEDITVLGVDNDDLWCEIARPSLSSIIVPAEAIGRRAAALADQLIKHKQQHATKDILLPPEGIVVRRSTDVLAIEDPNVVAALRFIRENSHRPLRVADVLREVPVSRSWLERRVFEEIGITLGAEIRRRRLERAGHLLLQTDMSIAEVASHSGFSDLRHIEAVFQQQMGCTPTQFRNRTEPSQVR